MKCPMKLRFDSPGQEYADYSMAGFSPCNTANYIVEYVSVSDRTGGPNPTRWPDQSIELSNEQVAERRDRGRNDFHFHNARPARIAT